MEMKGEGEGLSGGYLTRMAFGHGRGQTRTKGIFSTQIISVR